MIDTAGLTRSGLGRMPRQAIAIAVVGAVVAGFILIAPRLGTKLASVVALALVAPLLLLAVGSVRKILLALIALDIPFQLDWYFGSREPVERLGAISGFCISVTLIAVVLLYAQWFAEASEKRAKPVPGRAWRDALTPFPFLVACVISLLPALDFEVMRSFHAIFLYAQIFALYAYIVLRVSALDDIRHILLWCMIGQILQALVMYYLRIVRHSVEVASIQGMVEVAGGNIRVGGTLGHPNRAAIFLVSNIVLGLGLILSDLRGSIRVAAIVSVIVALPALALTESRGGWISLAIAVTIMLVLAIKQRWVSPVPVIAVGFALALLALAFGDVVAGRFVQPDGGSTHGRIVLNRLAWLIINDYPLWGTGVNTFAVAMQGYLGPDFNRAWVYTVHNQFLLVWAETGILGLICFAGYLLTNVIRAWRLFAHGLRSVAPIGLSVFALIIGQLPHMSVDLFNSRPEMTILALNAAMVVVLLREAKARLATARLSESQE